MEKYYNALEKYYGYQEFRDGQLEIIDSIYQGNDTIVLMATGGGKSLCFQIPGLLFDGLTLVISPLIALMDDQVKELSKIHIKAAAIHSNILDYVVEDTLANINNLKFLYLSPERLSNHHFLKAIKSVKISLIVIDEAHCISAWGHDFRPSYYKIKEFLDLNKVGVACFTATASHNTILDIKDSLGLINPNIYNYKISRSNLFYSVIRTNNKYKNLLLFLANKIKEKTIIYTLTIKEALSLEERLKKYHFNCRSYYGELDRDIKKEVFNDFFNNQFNILISTSSFGMGVNIPDIRNIIIYQMPLSLSDLEQQFGRAGRDGRMSECVFFFDLKDVKVAEHLIRNSSNDLKNIKKRYKDLEEVIHFGSTNKCLHFYLENYFEKKEEYSCNNCSNCLKAKKKKLLK